MVGTPEENSVGRSVDPDNSKGNIYQKPLAIFSHADVFVLFVKISVGGCVQMLYLLALQGPLLHFTFFKLWRCYLLNVLKYWK